MMTEAGGLHYHNILEYEYRGTSRDFPWPWRGANASSKKRLDPWSIPAGVGIGNFDDYCWNNDR